MAAINAGSNVNNGGSSGGSNMYRVGDYVYFETQQQQQPSHHQQPFQIRRIEELNKTAGGNVEAKVMCFYRRRDLPAQLVALADKHQQHQQQQQLLSSSPASAAIKSNKQVAAIKASLGEGEVVTTDNKEEENLTVVKKEQQESKDEGSDIPSEITEIVKEENQQQDGEVKEKEATDPVIPSADSDTKTENDEIDTNDKLDISEEKKAAIAASQAAQQQQDWWRGEQLKQRELFLSRQVETLAATHIRGKCTVTLYNETESLDSYLEREDTFFYCLVFDPVQKTLLADKGEIRVGHKYQAEVPQKALFNHDDSKTKEVAIKRESVKEESADGDEPMVTECEDDDKDVDTKSTTAISTVSVSAIVTSEIDSELETLVWTCRPEWNRLTDRQIDQFLVVSRSLGTFARALDCTSSVKQPSLHMSAAAASRDITLFHAMDTLHKHGYDLGTATCSLVPSTGPVLCRDEMEEWSASEANLFEEALEKYGKDFSDIRHDFLPWKTHKNIVEYYYMWKTTDRYVQQKRVKAVEQESKLKQVYIPSYNGTTASGKQQAITAAASIKSSQQLVNGNSSVELYSGKNSGSSTGGPLLPGVCDLCDAITSQQWYPNTLGTSSGSGYHQQNGGLSSVSSLCHECWTHWKKYGGPRTATSDKKTITGRGDSVSGDEERPPSNASSGSASAAMNLNISAGGGRSLSHAPAATTPHHHHHLMHMGGSSGHHGYHHQSQHHQQQQHHQQSSSPASQQQSPAVTGSSASAGLLHQPHINSSGSSSSTHRCTIIGCQSPAFKSKSQLLRHYSAAHGIGINANSGSTITASGGGRSSSGGAEGGALSPQPQQQQQQQQQQQTSAGLLNSGPLNLNSSSMQQANPAANQVINMMASSHQLQPNNLSSSGPNSTVTGAINAATGRPVMKTRTAFYLRCTSLTKASRRRAAQQAAAALLLQQKKSSPGASASVSPLATSVQPGCLARPRNVARRPFVCVPQAAHAYKHECMLSMQHAPVHELRAYLRAAAVKAHARRPGVTRVANALIAARRGRGGINSTANDLAVPDWLSLPSQQHHQSSHHHVSSGSKHGKHSSSRTSSGGRVAFPKPPKAADGSLLYERVPNKQEAAAAAAAVALNNPSAAAAAAAAAAAVGLNPATAAAILGALGPPGSAGGTGSPSDPSSVGFDVAAAAAALYQQQNMSSNKRRLYETENTAAQQPQPQAGPPSKRMHRQHHSQSSASHHHSQHQPAALHGGAVDGMLASLVAHQQQQQQRGAALQLTAARGSGGKSVHQQQVQQHNHYRTPSMARTGRKHVISWTDAPDDMYYKVVPFVKALRKAKMPRKELKRWGRKPWMFIPELGGISFRMPPSAAPPPASGPAPQSTMPVPATPFDMSTASSRQSAISNQSSAIVVPSSAIGGTSSRTSGSSGHH